MEKVKLFSGLDPVKYEPQYSSQLGFRLKDLVTQARKHLLLNRTGEDLNHYVLLCYRTINRR